LAVRAALAAEVHHGDTASRLDQLLNLFHYSLELRQETSASVRSYGISAGRVLYHYREQGKYRLHEFVVTPNHFDLLLTPAETLERAPQLVKGGFSFRAKRELDSEIWQSSYYDRRVRKQSEYQKIRNYIRQNPVRAWLVENPADYLYLANLKFSLDEVPQRPKPGKAQ
jgi:REP element-mobilizing transposase RayT